MGVLAGLLCCCGLFKSTAHVINSVRVWPWVLKAVIKEPQSNLAQVKRDVIKEVCQRAVMKSPGVVSE